MSKKNILVFPCGSEVALEIHRSLEHSIHFNLIGASSVSDHGKFVFRDYIGNLPFVSDEAFLSRMKDLVKEMKIDAIFPAMDAAIDILKKNEKFIGCKIVTSPLETTSICLSKLKTYSLLDEVIRVPKVYLSLDDVDTYPVFLKPDIGYGSRGILLAKSKEEVNSHISKYPNAIILEYLPGKEYTIDCFTNTEGDLLFVGPRERKRVSNGISVNSSNLPLTPEIEEIANRINKTMVFSGAWFFQLKEDKKFNLVLLEVAARMGGASSVHRGVGVNFASLSLFNEFGYPVSILKNDYHIEMDKALSSRYKLDIGFKHVYIDFDDTILLKDKINTKMIALVFDLLNRDKKVHLITKHKLDITKSLDKYRLAGLFDSIIHLNPEDDKSLHIKEGDSIFIDDSFAERQNISQKLGIPVFSVDMIEMLN